MRRLPAHRRTLCKRLLLPISVIGVAGTLAGGCGPKGSGEDTVTRVSKAALDCSTVPPAQQASDLKQFLTFTKDALNFFSAATATNPSGTAIASSVISFVLDNFIGGAPDISITVNQIKQELDCVSQGLDWKVTALAWTDDQYVPVEAAWMDLAQGFAIGSPDDNSSHQGTLDSGQLPMFERTFVPSSTDGDGSWKTIIANHNPDLVGPDPDQVFDWRFGFPRFMSLIAKRVAIIASLDPEFISNGKRNAELDGTTSDPGYRILLQQRLQQMIAGVRCEKHDQFWPMQSVDCGSTTQYLATNIACADVNTGLSVEAQVVLPDADSCALLPRCEGEGYVGYNTNCLANLPGQQTVDATMDSVRRQLFSQMPIFEVQSMIDSLYHLTHPTLDLTGAFGRIPATADRTMCLDVINGDPTPGNAVWLYWCTGSPAQQWSYDRGAQTITNTAFNECLEVKQIHIPFPWGDVLFDNRSQHAPAVIATCVSPPPPRQQWTYDPELGVLRSAEGTVLSIEGGSAQPTNAVLLDDYTGDITQQWHADLSDGESFWGQDYGFGANMGPPTDSWSDGFKGQCPFGRALTGLSAFTSGQEQAHSIFCGDERVPATQNINQVELFDSSLPASPWDWDDGYFKAECPNGYYAQGVSQDQSGVMQNLLCTFDGTLTVAEGTCHVETFGSGPDSADYRGPDWDPLYYKGQCAPGFVVAGVSSNAWMGPAGAPHALLCCPP